MGFNWVFKGLKQREPLTQHSVKIREDLTQSILIFSSDKC